MAIRPVTTPTIWPARRVKTGNRSRLLCGHKVDGQYDCRGLIGAIFEDDVANRGETERAIEHIAPEELRAAMRLLIRQGGGLGEEALLSQTARLFGFAKLGDNIRQRLQESYDELQKQGAARA